MQSPKPHPAEQPKPIFKPRQALTLTLPISPSIRAHTPEEVDTPGAQTCRLGGGLYWLASFFIRAPGKVTNKPACRVVAGPNLAHPYQVDATPATPPFVPTHRQGTPSWATPTANKPHSPPQSTASLPGKKTTLPTAIPKLRLAPKGEAKSSLQIPFTIAEESSHPVSPSDSVADNKQTETTSPQDQSQPKCLEGCEWHQIDDLDTPEDTSVPSNWLRWSLR